MTAAQLSTGEVQCTRCKQFKWPAEFGLKMGRRLPLCKSCVREQARKRKLLAKGLPTVADPVVVSQSPGAAPASVERPARRSERRGGSFIAPKQSTPSVTEPPLAFPRSVVAEIEVTDADLTELRSAIEFCGLSETRLYFRLSPRGWSARKLQAALEMVRVRA